MFVDSSQLPMTLLLSCTLILSPNCAPVGGVYPRPCTVYNLAADQLPQLTFVFMLSLHCDLVVYISCTRVRRRTCTIVQS
jgi:hypothetical protein